MCSTLPMSLSHCWKEGLDSDFHCCRIKRLANNVAKEIAWPSYELIEGLNVTEPNMARSGSGAIVLFRAFDK